MCGRFTLRAKTEELVQLLMFDTDVKLEPRYNIAPMRQIPIVRELDGHREMVNLQWKLLPSWSNTERTKLNTINATVENLSKSNTFRSPFKRRRCLIPVDGWYEWTGGKGSKKPYYFRRKDNEPFFFAGLWERWLGPKDGPPRKQPLESCTIITVEANDIVEPYHTRMPAVFNVDHADLWLDTEFYDEDTLKEFLEPTGGDEFIVSAVSPIVNSWKNDSPECIEAV